MGRGVLSRVSESILPEFDLNDPKVGWGVRGKGSGTGLRNPRAPGMMMMMMMMTMMMVLIYFFDWRLR